MKVKISILLLNTVSNSNHEIIVAKRGSETRNLIHGRVFVEGSVFVSFGRPMHNVMINVLINEYFLNNYDQRSRTDCLEFQSAVKDIVKME